ncbi:PocR ligand-binding domain-containing protein [Fundidesulfovibrio agrisoli]|uniref:PocR ligand-binding domain-containing protein n=1 Tax=Fundidesulfovibrio agrisoli TaxID=2922717 RepID=UPI001FAC25B8|nr:PocR ligand-binding domain-containing protein [Fundidesulfovibrio agrisoli]
MHNGQPGTCEFELSSLFDMEELQSMQDAFALATGVASVITDTSGNPITRPSNFCRLCKDIIRKTELGRANCFKSDAVLGRYTPAGLNVRRCLSSGLWDAGACIVVGGMHVANWLIGQVRTDPAGDEAILAYADALGTDREAFREALSEVPLMPLERFQAIAQALHLIANKLADSAYQNLRQAQIIREKSAAEESLRASEGRFRRLLEMAPLPISICGPDGSVEYLNEKFLSTFGYDIEDMPHLDDWWPLAYPDPAYRAYVRESWRNRMSLAHIPPKPFQVTCKDGSVRHVEISGANIGENILILFRDVTDQHLAGLRQRESEENLQTIFDSVSECIFVHDIGSGTLLDVNKRACETYGYSREEMLALDVGKLSSGEPPYDQQQAIEVMRKATVGEPQTLEWNARKRSGELFWIEVSCRVARFGQQDRLIVSARDISDRKRAQELMQREKAFSEAVMDSIPGLLYVYDDQGRLVRWNKKHSELTGYTDEELSRMTLFDWYKDDPDEIANITAAVARIPVDGYSEAEGNLQCKDGSKRLFLFTAVPLTMEGKDYFTGIGIDITERKRLYELMVQTEKMMSIGGLAAGMAHEINNPLSAILQSAQVLRMRLFSETSANLAAAEASGCAIAPLRDYLERRNIPRMLEGIEEAGRRAARIVAHMLEFSRKAESVKAPVPAEDLFAKAVEFCSNDYDLKKKYDFRKIRIDIEIERSLPPVPCTATQIEQVLMNLLRNAAQAMNTDQESGRQPRIELLAHQEGDYAVLEVADNGPGMAEAVRKRVFEPFFTTKATGEGTGLGLSVSYFIIVDNHKGAIEVDSVPGGGTRFTIRLPLHPKG